MFHSLSLPFPSSFFTFPSLYTDDVYASLSRSFFRFSPFPFLSSSSLSSLSRIPSRKTGCKNSSDHPCLSVCTWIATHRRLFRLAFSATNTNTRLLFFPFVPSFKIALENLIRSFQRYVYIYMYIFYVTSLFYLLNIFPFLFSNQRSRPTLFRNVRVA